MKKYDLIVIGFGKAGKTLAKSAAKHGLSVAMVEQSKKMYGGTCINVGCIPTKVLVHDADLGGDFKEAMARKQSVVAALNNKNYTNLVSDDHIDVIDGKATFLSNKEIEVTLADGAGKETLTADKIVINTGGTPVVPKITGIETAQRLYDSTGIMELSALPQELVIVGGGYISLEFASMFANFGTKVTVLEFMDKLLAREDEEIAALVLKDIEERGVTLLTGVTTSAFEEGTDKTIVKTNKGDFPADAVLVAIGRKPQTDLGLENTEITFGQRGEIATNEFLETAVEGVYAVGDVKGGLQFTYISLDDFRIVNDQLFGSKERSTLNRGAVPYTVFLDPPMSRIGLTAKEAQDKGLEIIEGKLPVAQIPRHKINNDPRGLFKVVVDAGSKEILGATLYGQNSEELINLIKIAMDQHLSYEVLRDAIYTHPTMSESFNDLFNI